MSCRRGRSRPVTYFLMSLYKVSDIIVDVLIGVHEKRFPKIISENV
jgi:hypothetical protein